MSTDGPAVDAVPEATLTWRELAVARSLDPARARAESRVQRFLDAALALMESESGKEFTVQEVVERSGQSLRSFYQHFAGKYELLLALFEESVRSTADHLRAAVAAEADAGERLRRFSVEYYRLCRPTRQGRPADPGFTKAMAEFAQQLLTSHPAEAARAFVPLVSLLEEILDDAAAAGLVRPRLDHRRIAGLILHAVMFNAFSTTIGGVRDDADAGEELWHLLLHGVGQTRQP